MGDTTLEKLIARLDDLEDEAGKNATRFDTIITSLNRLAVAVSGDPENDILGLVGRMKIIDADAAAAKKQLIVLETEIATLKPIVTANAAAAAEWNAAKQQLAGAGKVGSAVWAVIGAGGGALILKLFEFFK